MGKILVVDNQFGVRRLLVETFREDQHEVEMAANELETLKLLMTFEPDLIVMDMEMPGTNGLETLEKIRILGCRVAVIMMTSGDDLHNMEQAKELGILCYVPKPFDLFELRERVKEIFNSSGIITKG